MPTIPVWYLEEREGDFELNKSQHHNCTLSILIQWNTCIASGGSWIWPNRGHGLCKRGRGHVLAANPLVIVLTYLTHKTKHKKVVNVSQEQNI